MSIRPFFHDCTTSFWRPMRLSSFPEGLATVLELATIWQLLQVQKLDETPLILIGKMWAEFVSWARTYLSRLDFELASPRDLEIPQCVDTVDDAIALIKPHYDEWSRNARK